MGVYAAMSVAGAAAGLIAGGLLVTYASWRWVLFVNVPIGIAVALAAPAVLPGTARRPGRFDLPGTLTGTVGVAALVYGLSSAATSPDGTSHWGDGKVVAALTAAVVLLTAFAVIETRSRHALLPVRLLRSRDRLGANLIMLAVGTAVFGVFFFVTLFVQEVWGYSALRTGVAFLPLTVTLPALLTVALPFTFIARLSAPELFSVRSPAVVVPLKPEIWFVPPRFVAPFVVVMRPLPSTRLAEDCVMVPPGWSACSSTLPVVRIAVPNTVPFIWMELPGIGVPIAELPAVTLIAPPPGTVESEL